VVVSSTQLSTYANANIISWAHLGMFSLDALICNDTTSACSHAGAAVLHDKHLNGKEPTKMLRIVAALWAISMVGRAMGATTLASLLWITAFVVPKVSMHTCMLISDHCKSRPLVHELACST
jgi:hypothetical protein